MSVARKFNEILDYMRDLWPLRLDYTGLAVEHLSYQVRQIDDEISMLAQVSDRIGARVAELHTARTRVIEAQQRRSAA